LNLWVKDRNLGFSRFSTGDGTWEIQTIIEDMNSSPELNPCPALNAEEVSP
jgi:hypothetical protein